MTDIERQILLNQIAMIEALMPLARKGPESTSELLRRRYSESAQLVRENSTSTRQRG